MITNEELFADINIYNVKQKLREERNNIFNEGTDEDKAKLRILYCKYLCNIKIASSLTTEMYHNNGKSYELVDVSTEIIEHEHSSFDEYLLNIKNARSITVEQEVFI